MCIVDVVFEWVSPCFHDKEFSIFLSYELMNFSHIIEVVDCSI